jgi:hypothetical protein
VAGMIKPKYPKEVVHRSNIFHVIGTLILVTINLKRAASLSKAAQLAEISSNLAILGLAVLVRFDCNPKSLNLL